MLSTRTFPVWICVILLSGMFLAGWNGQTAIKDTGQDKCFDTTGEITCPSPGESFYGQDAQYAVGCQPSYTDNGDGTVTDNCTGLMWQQEDDNVQRNWEAALVYCETLELAEYTDWRLPNRRELESILDMSTHRPMINEDFFPGTDYGTNVRYWTSTTYVLPPELNAFGVRFGSGYTDAQEKTDSSEYTRCVR